MNDVNNKIQFQKIIITLLAFAFILFFILFIFLKTTWAITGLMISLFLLIDYLFIMIFFNGNASKKK